MVCHVVSWVTVSHVCVGGAVLESAVRGHGTRTGCVAEMAVLWDAHVVYTGRAYANAVAVVVEKLPSRTTGLSGEVGTSQVGGARDLIKITMMSYDR